MLTNNDSRTIKAAEIRRHAEKAANQTGATSDRGVILIGLSGQKLAIISGSE